MDDSPQTRQSPSGSDSFKEYVPEGNLFTDSRVGAQLKNALESMNSMGEEAEDRFQEALKQLRENPEEVLLEITEAFNCNCLPDDYPTKWGMVYLVTQLKHKSAYHFLKRLIKKPIPAERSKHPHSFSTVAEETVLRTTAIEALGYFMDKNQKDTQQLLLDVFRSGSLSMIRASAQTLAAAGYLDEMKDDIQKCLPEDYRYLLKIRPSKVQDVEQIKDPERHLKPLPEGVERREKKDPPRFGDFNEQNQKN